MTDSDRLLPVPDDDALDAAASAVADGVATPEEEAALAAAPGGAARLAAHQAVARAVGAPAGEQDRRAAARGLAAALAASAAEPGRGDGPMATARPRATATATATVTSLPPPRTGRTLPRLGAVAAMLLLLVGIGSFAVAALRSTGSGDETTFAAAPTGQDAAKDAAAEAAAGSTAPQAAAAAGAPRTATAGGLPPQAPGRQLDPSGGGALAAAPLPPVVNGGDLGGQDEVEAVAQRLSLALSGTPAAADTAGEVALPSDVQACVGAAAATANETVGPLRYRATGRYQGTPAVFLAFDRPTGSPPLLLLVLARDGCPILASTHF